MVVHDPLGSLCMCTLLPPPPQVETFVLGGGPVPPVMPPLPNIVGPVYQLGFWSPSYNWTFNNFAGVVNFQGLELPAES